MPKLAANLSMLFGEFPFMARFEQAAKAGFKAVEYLFPYPYPAAELQQQLRDFGLEQALFNAPPGDWDAGERGLACIPGREAEFGAGLEAALAYAAQLGNRRIHVMAGITPAAVDPVEVRACYIANLQWAAAKAASAGITLLIEPINNRDMPGYFLNYPDEAVALLDAIAAPNVRLQFDCYHCQRMQGDVVATFARLQPWIEHIQIAGVPGRHEPDLGELNYGYILNAFDQAGYQGFVGCEYLPSTTTWAGLGWMQRIVDQ